MPRSPLTRIRIVLVEPAGPLNVGSVARVMKNMGLQHLTLINPQCDHQGAEARQMAVHAADILEAAHLAPTLPAGLIGCRKVVATTGRDRTPDTPLELPLVVLPWLLTPVTEAEPASDGAALVFGPEDRGLNTTELNHAHRFLQIPAHPVYPSLNLAQAVGICCYELSQLAAVFSTEIAVPLAGRAIASAVHPQAAPPMGPPPAAIEELESFYESFAALLLQIGYLYPHTADRRMQKFRRLFRRAMPSSEEVSMLRGIIRQMQWALEQADRRSPPEPSSDDTARD